MDNDLETPKFYVLTPQTLLKSVQNFSPGDALVCPNAIFYKIDDNSNLTHQVIVKKNPLLVVSKIAEETSEPNEKMITVTVLSVSMGILVGIFTSQVTINDS